MNLASQKNIISRSVSGFSHPNDILRKSAAISGSLLLFKHVFIFKNLRGRVFRAELPSADANLEIL